GDATGRLEPRDPETSDYRYPLFSDAERRAMCARLSRSLGSKSTGSILADLDSASKRSDTNCDFSVAEGPFGVFRMDESDMTSVASRSSSSGSTHHTASDIDDKGTEESIGLPGDLIEFNWSPPDQDIDFQSFLDNMDLSMGQDDVLSSTEAFTGSISDLLADIPTDLEAISDFCLAEEGAVPEKDMPTLRSDTNVTNQVAVGDTVPSPPLSINLDARSDMPEQAQALLRYYKTHIESAPTCIQSSRWKSPWKLLFLPCAFETFAELSLLGGTSHTRSAILCALLSHSAFQLHKSDSHSQSDYWHNLGVKHRDRAQKHLRSAVETEASDSEQTKYKELLMAFIAMAMISIYQGNRTARIFLLDAERLIRVRGLAEENPELIRVLHHVYTYLRVIAEGIYALDDGSIDSEQAEAFSHVPESGSFRISEDLLNIGLDPGVEKNSKVGYGDIHLQVQGRWKETLHSRIHGIPESLMTLLSQTISLANEKKRLETRARCDPKLAADLKHHIKTLEERIWTWSSSSEVSMILTGDVSFCTKGPNLVCHPRNQAMISAIHRALIIYFYRQVHDVSAMILQDVVRQALEQLESCISEMINSDDFALSLAWAAFICAREAISPDLQDRARHIISITDSRGVYFTSRPAMEVISSLWAKRQAIGGIDLGGSVQASDIPCSV
ncbi:C6 transcription factor, partial [Colletotrichum asianum]